MSKPITPEQRARYNAIRREKYRLKPRKRTKEQQDRANELKRMRRKLNGIPDKERLASLERAKLWREKNPERVREHNRRRNAKPENVARREVYKRTPKGRYNNAKGQAKSRKKDFTLSLAEFTYLINQPCFYCKGELGTLPEIGAGLDRVRNDLGYIPFNCVPCCTGCNSIKGDRLTSKETLEAVHAIIEYRKRTASGT